MPSYVRKIISYLKKIRTEDKFYTTT